MFWGDAATVTGLRATALAQLALKVKAALAFAFQVPPISSQDCDANGAGKSHESPACDRVSAILMFVIYCASA